MAQKLEQQELAGIVEAWDLVDKVAASLDCSALSREVGLLREAQQRLGRYLGGGTEVGIESLRAKIDVMMPAMSNLERVEKGKEPAR